MHGYEDRMKIAVDIIIANIIDNWNKEKGKTELTYQAEKEVWTYGIQKRPDYMLIREHGDKKVMFSIEAKSLCCTSVWKY